MHYPLLLCATCVFLVVLQPSSGMFIQAISAALATVPFTGGPIAMTAGLAAAKLAIGSKLLFYLGYFRNRGLKPPIASPIPNAATILKSAAAVRQQYLSPLSSMQGYSALPLPYMFPAAAAGGGGAYIPQQFGAGGFQSGFPQNFPPQYAAGQSFNPSHLMQAYGEGGGFQGAGQGNYPSFAGNPEAAYSNQGFPKQMGSSFPNQAAFPQQGYPQHQDSSGIMPGDMPQDFSASLPPSDEGGPPVSVDNEDDIESFFTFLRDMDDNKCISRLICDIGADPNFLGEFSQNINGIISSLEVSPDSRASQYVSTLQQGREDQGGCTERYSECTEEAYEIVKSVAPSVGIPQNVNSAAD